MKIIKYSHSGVFSLACTAILLVAVTMACIVSLSGQSATPIANPVVLGEINYGVSVANQKGDTNVATGFLPTGTFTWKEPAGTIHTLNGDVHSVLNDTSAFSCLGNVCLTRVVNLDFQTPANSSITMVNSMADMVGVNAPAGWGGSLCSGCPASAGAVWHSGGPVSINGVEYLNIFRANNGGATAGDSTLIKSHDQGLHWSNPANTNLATVTGSAYSAGVLTLTVASTTGLATGNTAALHDANSSACNIQLPSITVVLNTSISSTVTNPGVSCTSGKVDKTSAGGDPPAIGAGTLWPYTNYGAGNAIYSRFTRVNFIVTCQDQSIGCSALPPSLAGCDPTLGHMCFWGNGGYQGHYYLGRWKDITKMPNLLLSETEYYQPMGGQGPGGINNDANWVVGSTGYASPGYLANAQMAIVPATVICCGTAATGYPESYIATGGTMSFIPTFNAFAFLGWSIGETYSDPHYSLLRFSSAINADGPWAESGVMPVLQTGDLGFTTLMPFTFIATGTNPPSGKIIMSGDLKGLQDVSGTGAGTPRFQLLSIGAGETSTTRRGVSRMQLAPNWANPGAMNTSKMAWLADMRDNGGVVGGGATVAQNLLTGQSLFYGTGSTTLWAVPTTPPLDGAVQSAGVTAVNAIWGAIGMQFNGTNGHMISVGNLPVTGNPAAGWGISTVVNLSASGALWSTGSSYPGSGGGGWGNVLYNSAAGGSLAWFPDWSVGYGVPGTVPAGWHVIDFVMTQQNGTSIKALEAWSMYLDGTLMCGPAGTKCPGTSKTTALYPGPLILGSGNNNATGDCSSSPGLTCSAFGQYITAQEAGITVWNVAPTKADIINHCKRWAKQITQRGATAMTCPTTP